MRSRAEIRRNGEWLLRAMLLAALGISLWRSMRTTAGASTTTTATSRTVDVEVERAITSPAAASLDLSVDGEVSRHQRDALLALRRAGTHVTWHGDIPPLAVEVVREREPDARARLMITGGGSQPIVLADSAGTIDTVRASQGATIDVGTVVGDVRAAIGAHAARANIPAASSRRGVMVLSRAGWESKFAISALSEAGWVVRARIPAAPNVDVRDDGLLPLDTARYDAVIALDSSAADFAPAIARFVAQGGGLIAVGGAMSLDLLRGIVPAQPGERRVGRILLAEDTVTPPDLPVRPLTTLRRDAVTLEKETAGVTLAARRAGLGRVLAVGYDESWRWRMLGGTSGVGAHREWWSRAVGSVSPERDTRAPSPDGDGAPRAAIIDALGPSSSVATAVIGHASNPLPLILLVVIVLALLTEIASRRFRGSR